MLIEIYGAGFFNKGANLMLQVVAEELRQRLPGVELCLEPGIDRPYPAKAGLGLYSLWSVYPAGRYGPKFKPAWMIGEALAKVLPRGGLRSYGIVKRTEVDAFLDISGLSYGDKMGWRPARRTAFVAQWYRNRNVPVVLLPQMFGPFEQPGVAGPTKTILEHSDLVYARDPYSFEAVEKLVGKQEKLRQAPDLTLFTQAPDAAPPAPSKTAYIVPNHQVLRHGLVVKGDAYLDTLRRIEAQIVKAGYEAKFLIHDGSGKDRGLIEEVLQGRSLKAHAAHEEDPVRLKKMIGQSAFIVASRFHAVAGALSQGVPSLTIGWGYKYEALHEDLGVPHLCLSDETKLAGIGARIEAMATDRPGLTKTLLEHREAMRTKNAQMWDEVLTMLTKRS